jgi:2-oxoglutarate ferredoxin oxidoreductase subunit delta
MSSLDPHCALSIEIDSNRCTGCSICVEFCNRSVLGLKANHAKVIRIDKCSACRLCELLCPDTAIIITKESK